MLRTLVVMVLLCTAFATKAVTWTVEYAGIYTAVDFSCQVNCPPPVYMPWHPVLSFDTLSAADGTYVGMFERADTPVDPNAPPDTLTRVTLWDGGTMASFDTADPRFGTPAYTAFVGRFTATIFDGRLTSFIGAFAGQLDSFWSISETRTSYTLALSPTYTSAFADRVTPIPEPSAYALLLGGLGLLGVAARRRRQAACADFRNVVAP